MMETETGAMRNAFSMLILVLALQTVHAGEEPAAAIPAEVQQFIRENLKGCEVLSSRTELKTNAVLARLMSDLYKSRHEYHFELRDVRGETFKLRMQDFSKIERLDDCHLRVADLPPAVQKRLNEIGAGVTWEDVCEACKDGNRFVRYELRGRKGREKIRAALLHDGTVIAFPGMKNERVRDTAASPAAQNPFIENALIAPRD